MDTELRKLGSFEEVKEYVSLPLSEGVPYTANWDIAYGDLLTLISATLSIVETILSQNPGKVIANQMSFLRLHAVAMKERSNKHGVVCGYVELVFENVVSKKIAYVGGVNAFPIENNGTVYFSPATMLFIPEPTKGLDFGEIKIKECKTVW